MKNIFIRLFLISTFLLITNGFECGTDTTPNDEPIQPEADVNPKTTSVGDTVYCDLIRQNNGYDLLWRIEQKPTSSNTTIQTISGSKDAFFIPDVIGIYKITLVYDLGSRNALNKDFTVEVVQISAYAGDDISVNVGTNVSLDGSGSFGDQLTYFWNLIGAPVGANLVIANPTSVFATYLVDIPGDYFIQLKVTDVNQISDYDTLKITATEVPTGDIWTALTDYPGEGTSSIIAVSADAFGYVGLGATNTGTIKKDFWRFDPAGNGGSGSWSQLIDFPADDTRDCAVFVLGGKIYVGLGSSSYPVQTSRKFYVYDPSTNTWDDGNAVLTFPGEPRQNASTFVLDGEAYVGLGYKNSSPSQLFNDMYKYSAASNTWQPLNPFSGGARFAAISFVLNNTAYVGYGVQTIISGFIDFYSYNKSADNWTNITAIQPLNSTDTYYHSVGVATSTNGYLIGGGLQTVDNAKQVWHFNSPNNSWTRKTNSIAQLIYAAGFVINDKVYCGGGGNKKWYRYDPSLDLSKDESLVNNSGKTKRN